MNTKQVAVILPLFLLQTIASAAPLGNEPFAKKDWPATVAIQKLKAEKETDNMVCFRDTDANKTEVRLYSIDWGWPVYVEIFGDKWFEKTELCDGALSLTSVYAADLNLDGKPDYIIDVPTGGNGLGAAASYVCFLLSSPNGFTLTRSDTYCFDQADFVLLGGKPRFVKSSYAWEQQCKDGKEHSFWIYNLLGFESGTIQKANDSCPGFPKMVWYSYAENHRETTLLTAEQKKMLIEGKVSSEEPKPSGE